VCQTVGQLPVVGQHEQARGVVIETANGKQSGRHRVLDDVHDRAAVHARLVGRRGEGRCRLVEEHGDALLGLADSPAVDPYVVAGGVGKRRQIGDDLPVDFHRSVTDELLARSAAGNTRVGQDALEPFLAGRSIDRGL